MCGLVALISPSVPIDSGLLRVMRDRLVHRGPDSAGMWIDDGRTIGLGHRRLSVIDRSAAADQPMVSADGMLRIIYNGEIYNYLELRSELGRLGVRFRTRSDTEVLLAAYQTWGAAALSRLNGMFAFALWDGARREMMIARDRFGEKPLFIGRGRHSVLGVASEMKALLPHPLISQTVSTDSVTRFGEGIWREDDTKTFFESVERLPPAHAVVFDAWGIERRRWRYWTPNYDPMSYRIRPEEAAEEFRGLFAGSVALRLRSDVAVGSSLSGGLDSSTIVAQVACERAEGSFIQNTFSACFPSDPTLSEEPEIDRVVAHTGVHSYKVAPSENDLKTDSMLLHWHQEEPFYSASIFAQWSVAKLASEQNTTVLLDGQGADELLAGYHSLFPLRQLDLVDRGRMSAALNETHQFNHRLSLAASAFTDVTRRFNPNVAYSDRELLDFAAHPPTIWHNDYGAGVAPAVPGGRLRRTLSETLLYNGLPMLLRYGDRNAMAFGREPRLPFLDHRLVDFCTRLPDDYLIRDGIQKWILRKMASRFLPDSIVWRADKVGYATPLDNWLRGGLRDWARERLFDLTTRKLPGYDPDAVAKLWNEHESATHNHSWALWRWISIAEWMEMSRCGYWRCGQQLFPKVEKRLLHPE